MKSQMYLSEDANIADLVSQMSPTDALAYEAFGHLRADPGFVGRIYVLFRPTGLTKEGQHREPEIIGQVRIVDWVSSAAGGSTITFEDMSSGETMKVGHVPRRLFDYDIFVSAPPYGRVRWEGRRVGEVVKRSMLFSLLIKTAVRSSFYSKSVTFCESPKCLKELYPNLQTQISFI